MEEKAKISSHDVATVLQKDGYYPVVSHPIHGITELELISHIRDTVTVTNIESYVTYYSEFAQDTTLTVAETKKPGDVYISTTLDYHASTDTASFCTHKLMMHCSMHPRLQLWRVLLNTRVDHETAIREVALLSEDITDGRGKEIVQFLMKLHQTESKSALSQRNEAGAQIQQTASTSYSPPEMAEFTISVPMYELNAVFETVNIPVRCFASLVDGKFYVEMLTGPMDDYFKVALTQIYDRLEFAIREVVSEGDKAIFIS